MLTSDHPVAAAVHAALVGLQELTDGVGITLAVGLDELKLAQRREPRRLVGAGRTRVDLVPVLTRHHAFARHGFIRGG